MTRLSTLLCMVVWLASCGGGPRGTATATSTTSSSASSAGRRASLPAIPSPGRSAAEQREYLRWHYWDGFDFGDTLALATLDTLHLLESYARFVALLSDRPNDPAPIDTLMRRASASRPMLDYFVMLADGVLHDPNSPLRNDELYLPVLRAQLASPWYDRYERLAVESSLRLAMQNRVGHRANDFRYELLSGEQGRLYDLQAEYLLLFISNPGCALCGELCGQIEASPMLSEMIERGRLRVLSLYPDEDADAWRAHAADLPRRWLNARDPACAVRDSGIYDLRAIPALYLLDREKRVLVKDATDVARIEETIDRRN